MEANTYAYDVCRHFVEDEINFVGRFDENLCKRILGYVRNRDLSKLSTCRSHVGDIVGENGLPLVFAMEETKFLMQIEAFFKKNAVYADEAVTSAAALDTFYQCEEKCKETNARLDDHEYNKHTQEIGSDLVYWVDKATAYISEVLGPFDDFIAQLPELVRVTTGATSTRSRKQSLPPKKVGPTIVCTQKVKPYVEIMAQYFGYDINTRITNWNRVEFVLKNWQTKRTIACESEGNIPFQLAFDTFGKRRLRAYGINLSDQSKNRRMAKEASITGSDATVDVKTASDTCAQNAVWLTFPYEWAKYLDDIRAPSYHLCHADGDREYGDYHKFSSMGNGSTFCIETLLFAAACKAVGSRNFSVYGDDIIIEADLYGDLVKLLAYLGFDINQSKSYTTGPFRESCGGNYYNGVDITPFYIRNVDQRKAVMCHNVNGLQSIAVPYGELWNYLRQIVEDNNLPLVPYSENSMSGVWVDTQTAYTLGLIKSKKSILMTKALVQKSKRRVFRNSRATFLWYLRSSTQSRSKVSMQIDNPKVAACVGAELEEALISSQYTTSGHKYVRKWVCWNPPASVVSGQLHSWSDYVARREPR